MAEITLRLKSESYEFLNHTLNNHLNLLHITGMNEGLKKELIKDVSKIKDTLRSAEKKGG